MKRVAMSVRVRAVGRAFGRAFGRALVVAAGAAAGLAMLGPGCAGGHGKYVSEGISLAQDRMAAVKAATELDMGRQAFLAGDLEKALKKIDSALSIREDSAAAFVLRGRVLVERGQTGEALVALERAAELQADNVEAQYYLGVVYERLAQPERALGHFVAASELDPLNPQYVTAAGETLVDLERLSEAKALLEGSEVSRHAAGVRQLLGHIAMIEQRPADAAALFNEARLLSPEDMLILEDLARAQSAAGLSGEAERSLSRLLAVAGNEGRRDLLHMRGAALLALARPAEARSVYAALVERADGVGDTEAWIGLGRASAIVGDEAKLRRAASRVVALAPDRAEGYLLFAIWQRSRGETGKAAAALGEAMSRLGEDADLLRLQAELLGATGATAAADAARSRADALVSAAAGGSVDGAGVGEP